MVVINTFHTFNYQTLFITVAATLRLRNTRRPIARNQGGTYVLTDNNKKSRSTVLKHRLCLKCNAPHPLYSCQEFLNLDLQNKLSFIKEKGFMF
jgi:hypothetical protein